MELKDIEKVIIHWSESGFLYEHFKIEGDDDIEKEVSPEEADRLIKLAAEKVGLGYDKTNMTIIFKNGKMINEIKFYLTKTTKGLIDLIK